MLLVAKEKVNLIVEVLNKFAPYMDNSTDLFQKMGSMISSFGKLMEAVAEMPEQERKDFMPFVQSFNSYIEDATTNYNDLRAFYSYMSLTTNQLMLEFKESIGVMDNGNPSA